MPLIEFALSGFMDGPRDSTKPRSISELIKAGRTYLAMLKSVQDGETSLLKYDRLPLFTDTYHFVSEEFPAEFCLYGRHGSHISQGSPSPTCIIPGLEFWRLRAWTKDKKKEEENARKIHGYCPTDSGSNDGSSFWNGISLDGTVLNAQFNFAGKEEPMHWSEIVTYSIALRNLHGSTDEGSRKEAPVANKDEALKTVGRIRRIIRSNICNAEWGLAKEEVVQRYIARCQTQASIEPRIHSVWQDIWFEVLPGSPEFEMMMGTVNGMGLAYLLAHNRESFPAGIGIAAIRLNPANSAMEFKLEVPNR